MVLVDLVGVTGRNKEVGLGWIKELLTNSRWGGLKWGVSSLGMIRWLEGNGIIELRLTGLGGGVGVSY